MDGACGALGHTFAAQLANVEINICEIVLYSYSAKGTGLGTLTAAYTSRRAGLASVSTLFLIAASDVNTTVLHTLLAQLNNTTRTGLDTSSTSHTLVLIDNWQACFGIYT